MKRFLSVLLTCVLALAFWGCSNTTDDGKKIKNVKDAEMSITLSSGESRTGVYTGEVVDDKMHGQGSFTATNSEGVVWTYTGEFKNGAFDGKGKTVWGEEERVEEGIYKNEYLNGEGIVYINGIVSEEGTFKEGLLNGEGKMYDESGKLLYEGTFDMGRPAIEPIGLNTAASFADWEYTCTKAEEHTSIGEYSTQEKYIVYLISSKNNSKGSRDIGQFFMVEDGQGRIYDMNTEASLEYHHVFKTANWYLDEAGASLTLSDVPFVFEVPKDSNGFKLIPVNAYYQKVPAIEVEITK